MHYNLLGSHAPREYSDLLIFKYISKCSLIRVCWKIDKCFTLWNHWYKSNPNILFLNATFSAFARSVSFRKCFSLMKIFLPFALINFIFTRYAWSWGKENIWKVSLFDLNSRFLLLNTRFIEQTILLNERFYWANDFIEQFFNEKKSDNFENEWNKFFFERLWLEQDGSLMNDKGTKWKKFNIPISMWLPSEHWAQALTRLYFPSYFFFNHSVQISFFLFFKGTN